MLWPSWTKPPGTYPTTDYHADWMKSSANEFCRLANVVGGHVKGANTIKFVCKKDIPHN